MAQTRRVAKYDETGTFFIEEESIPDLDDGEVLVDVAAAGVSAGTHGSHVQHRRENPDEDRSPRSIGYQSAGKVIETGTAVTRFEPGDRIAAMGGGYAIQADYNVVPTNLCTHLPDSVPYEAGAYIHLASTALNGIRRADPDPGAFVAVFGLGVVGQMAAQEARIAGCSVLGCDLFELRRRKAASVGISERTNPNDADFVSVAEEFTDGRGLDGGFMCFAGPADEPFNDLVDAMKEGPDGETLGEVVLIGGVDVTVSGGAAIGNVDIRPSSRTGPGYHDPDFERGDDYPSGYVEWTTTRNLDTVTRWLSTGRLEIEPLITHRFSLEDINDAYDQVLEHTDETLGVIIESELSG